MRRFDKDGDHMLRYSEFCEAFLPVDNFHASLLAKKAPQIGVTQTQVMFCPSTMEQYRDVWAVHLRNEMLIEKLRADNGAQIIMQQAFEILDCNRDKYIDRDDSYVVQAEMIKQLGNIGDESDIKKIKSHRDQWSPRKIIRNSAEKTLSKLQGN